MTVTRELRKTCCNMYVYCTVLNHRAWLRSSSGPCGRARRTFALNYGFSKKTRTMIRITLVKFTNECECFERKKLKLKIKTMLSKISSVSVNRWFFGPVLKSANVFEEMYYRYKPHIGKGGPRRASTSERTRSALETASAFKIIFTNFPLQSSVWQCYAWRPRA